MGEFNIRTISGQTFDTIRKLIEDKIKPKVFFDGKELKQEIDGFIYTTSYDENEDLISKLYWLKSRENGRIVNERDGKEIYQADGTVNFTNGKLVSYIDRINTPSSYWKEDGTPEMTDYRKFTYTPDKNEDLVCDIIYPNNIKHIDAVISSEELEQLVSFMEESISKMGFYMPSKENFESLNKLYEAQITFDDSIKIATREYNERATIKEKRLTLQDILSYRSISRRIKNGDEIFTEQMGIVYDASRILNSKGTLLPEELKDTVFDGQRIG